MTVSSERRTKTILLEHGDLQTLKDTLATACVSCRQVVDKNAPLVIQQNGKVFQTQCTYVDKGYGPLCKIALYLQHIGGNLFREERGLVVRGRARG